MEVQAPEEQHAEKAAVVTTGEHPAVSDQAGEQQHAADAPVAAPEVHPEEGEQAEQLGQRAGPGCSR